MMVRYRLGLRIAGWIGFLLFLLLLLDSGFAGPSLIGFVTFTGLLRGVLLNRFFRVDTESLQDYTSLVSLDFKGDDFLMLDGNRICVVRNGQKRRTQMFKWMADSGDWEKFEAWVRETQPRVEGDLPLHLGPIGKIGYPVGKFLARHARALGLLFLIAVLAGGGRLGYGIWRDQQEIRMLFAGVEEAISREDWHQAIELAGRLEERIPEHKEALLRKVWDLRSQAREAIRPKLALRAARNGVEIPATVRIDGVGERKVLTLPATWKALGPGRRYILFASAEQDGQWLQAARVEVLTDWEGLRELDLELESFTGPAPVPGGNWRSPSTGMEFVWVEDLGVAVGKYEVTNAEYRKMNPDHDSGTFAGHTLNGGRQPVVQVSFRDAVAFAEWLTLREYEEGRLPHGYHYRLPSVTEIQAMHRLGEARQPNPWGGDWPPPETLSVNYSGKESPNEERADDWRDDFPVTAEVDALWINPWGLAGVAGNVWETASWQGKDVKFRYWHGGAWTTDPHALPGLLWNYLWISHPTSGSYDQQKNHDGGFRLVLSR